jgi:hypothetical protein
VNAPDAPAFHDQVIGLRPHQQPKARIAAALFREKIQKIPLRHQRDELAARRQMAEVRQRQVKVSELA